MREHSILGLGPHGFHRIVYSEWGDAANPRVIVCVHGLTRTRHDFDIIAGRLAERYRVICPDMPGRGDSEWLADRNDYAVPVYCADMAALIARLDVAQVDWLGTSMGGIIGMSLAAQPNSPIRRMVLNDVGAFIPKEGLAHIASYVAAAPSFANRAEAESFVRTAMKGFGVTSEDHWRLLIDNTLRPGKDGTWRLHYDPAIGQAVAAAEPKDVSLWPLWVGIRCPVMVLHGAESGILTAETLDQMTKHGPVTDTVTFPNVGHAPMLMNDDQIAPVLAWLAKEA